MGADRAGDQGGGRETIDVSSIDGRSEGRASCGAVVPEKTLDQQLDISVGTWVATVIAWESQIDQRLEA